VGAFDADEVLVRECLGQARQKLSVAKTDFNSQRRIAAKKD
jgi:hypothetical protein